MALLGHSSRLLLRVPQPLEVQQAWEAAGFTIEDAYADAIRCTDGQVMILIQQGESTVPELVYYGPSLQSVRDRLVSVGEQAEITESQRLRVAAPGALTINVLPAKASLITHRTGDSNPVIGFLDAMVVPVTDADDAARWAQNAGFFIAETTPESAIPCADVTDGLWMISFREQSGAAPFLHYSADIDDEWVEQFVSAIPNAIVYRDTEQVVTLVTCVLPGGLQFMITNDELH